MARHRQQGNLDAETPAKKMASTTKKRFRKN
jgi:hypothetical protein